MAKKSNNVLIALNLATSKLGGTERYLAALTRALRPAGVNITISLTACSPIVEAFLSDAGARVVVTGKLSGSEDVTRALVGSALVASADVVVLHFFPFLGPWLLPLRATGARLVYVDDHSGAANESVSRPRPRFRRVIRRRIAASYSRIIAVSNYVGDRHRVAGGVDSNRVEVIHNGVEVPEYPSPMPLRYGRRIVLAVGNLIGAKGFDHLIRAFEKLQEPAALHIVGDGLERKELESLAQIHGGGHVHFLGQRNDVPMLMAKADVVAVPSVWQEAFGFVIAEAMAAGRPVIASRVGGIPELIEHERSGLLVPPGSPDALAESMDRLLADSNLRVELGKQAHARAAQLFHIDRTIFGYANTILRTLDLPANARIDTTEDRHDLAI